MCNFLLLSLCICTDKNIWLKLYARQLIHTNKRAAKEFADRPLSYFSMSKERIVWRTGGATNAGMPVQTSARFVEPGQRPSSTSSTYISRKRLEDAWAHEAEVSGRTVEEVVSDLWLKPIGDMSSIYDELYALET